MAIIYFEEIEEENVVANLWHIRPVTRPFVEGPFLREEDLLRHKLDVLDAEIKLSLVEYPADLSEFRRVKAQFLLKCQNPFTGFYIVMRLISGGISIVERLQIAILQQKMKSVSPSVLHCIRLTSEGHLRNGKLRANRE